MLLQELFPTFEVEQAQLEPPAAGERGQVLSIAVTSGHFCRWVFDGHPDTLPELLDSIFTAAAEHCFTRAHAYALSKIAIDKHAELRAALQAQEAAP